METSTPKVTIPKIVAPVVPVTLEPDEREPRLSVPHTSFSQVSTYLRCSMQYYYAYILKLRQRPSLAMSIGSGGHSALEYNGRHKIKTGEDLAASDLLDMASTYIDHETEDLSPADLKPGEAIGDSKDRAIAAIRIYRVRDAEAIKPAGVEVEFNLDINTGEDEPVRVINGKIDLITEDAGIEDYKFAGKMKSQSDVDVSPQLTLYGKVFRSLTGKYPSKVGLRIFTPGNTRASPDSRPLYRDDTMMTPAAQEAREARVTFQIRQAEKGINAGFFIPADDPRTCSWCGYRDRCQSSLVTDFEAAKIRGEL